MGEQKKIKDLGEVSEDGKKITMTFDDLIDKIDGVMKYSFAEGEKHKTPSEETSRLFKSQEEINTRLVNAIFGDPNDDKDIGMKGKIEEVHMVFTRSNWAVKMVVKVFGGVGVIAGGIMSLIFFFKEFKIK